jgi:hypothetical protein
MPHGQYLREYYLIKFIQHVQCFISAQEPSEQLLYKHKMRAECILTCHTIRNFPLCKADYNKWIYFKSLHRKIQLQNVQNIPKSLISSLWKAWNYSSLLILGTCVCWGALNGDTAKSQSLQNANMTTIASVTKIIHTHVQCENWSSYRNMKANMFY